VSESFVRDYVHSVDVARTVATALEGAHVSAPVLNVGTGIGTSNVDLLSLLPDAAYTESESPSTPSFSVADMTLAREVLDLGSFVTIAEAVQDWKRPQARA
jgi:UDP-glucose 4-epimerase